MEATEHRSEIAQQRRARTSIFHSAIMRQAALDALAKLHPRHLLANPVMLVVELGAALTTVMFVQEVLGSRHEPRGFTAGVSAWLWFTVLFANFAEAMAEGRGKAQANTLRSMRGETFARRETGGGGTEMVPSADLRKGDVMRVEAGEIIAGDGDIIEGVAYVNEAAITGESAPVLKEPGTDIRSSVTGGTTVTSDWLRIRVTADPGETFLDKMIALVEGAQRQKTPNEIALNILLAAFTIIFLLAVGTIRPFVGYVGGSVTTTALVALLVCLIPTTIGGLLSAIGIAGMDRLVQHNVLAMSGKAVETAGDIDTLILDKTGTITFGNRLATEFIPVDGVTEAALITAAVEASVADETPEGRSILALARTLGFSTDSSGEGELIPFTAETRMSGVRMDGHRIMKGAVDAVAALSPAVPDDLHEVARRISVAGGTPLAVVDNTDVLGVIYLKDTVKPGIRERFEEMHRAGIRTVMVTGDNRLTAATIAAEAGVNDFVAEAKPEDKIGLIRAEQAKGHLVGMTGDGTNDAPALAQADVGVAMNSGTAAAKEAANMVDLDSDPTKLMEVVTIGKQLLMTRGALTTFSIANDVSKYFAIIPAMFVGVYPQLDKMNVMRLSTPQSAILSAVIFNALIIVALIPLALRGVAYRAAGAGEILQRNLLIYGLGGLVAPFVGIKLIDLLLVLLHLN
ncbi:MAG TPA: potassium-transporting ATPase subunit KdpB [Dehalococcoidia bacterium]|nr:potassium-transporting ATPase subunit KdpB [Dehalococcoidia bacterium]